MRLWVLPGLIAVMILLTVSLADAQLPNRDRFGSGFNLDPMGVPYSSRYWQGRPKDVVLSLVRKPELTEDQFVLRMTDRHPVSGCVEISNYGFETEYRDIYLDIALHGMIVDMRNQTLDAHFACDRGNKIPVADIILNRQDLLKNQTQQIRMHNGTDTNYYNITLKDHMVKILPDPADIRIIRRFKPHNIPSRKTALVYWFYPLGTVLLWTAEPQYNRETAAKLATFAQTKGLLPLHEIYPDFQSPLIDRRYQYYVDTTGRYADDAAALADGMKIGHIVADKTVYGLVRDETVQEEIAVFARTPGMYD